MQLVVFSDSLLDSVCMQNENFRPLIKIITDKSTITLKDVSCAR